jgi:hypothetical protein
MCQDINCACYDEPILCEDCDTLRAQLAEAQRDRAKLIEALRHVINQAVANDSLFMQFTDNRRVGDLLARLEKKGPKTFVKNTNTRWCNNCESIRSPDELCCLDCNSKTEEIKA